MSTFQSQSSWYSIQHHRHKPGCPTKTHTIIIFLRWPWTSRKTFPFSRYRYIWLDVWKMQPTGGRRRPKWAGFIFCSPLISVHVIHILKRKWYVSIWTKEEKHPNSCLLSHTVKIPQHLKQSVYIGLHKMDLYIKQIYLFILIMGMSAPNGLCEHQS